MKRVPLLPTLVVGLAVAAMIALGLWQLLDRLPRKEAFLAQLAANPAKPVIAFPRTPDESLLFRRANGDCSAPVSIALRGAGTSGFRAIAECGGGNGMVVQLGTTRDPKAKPVWSGGAVVGRIANAPDGRSLVGSLFDRTPGRLMLVLDPPVAGLAPNAPPKLDSVPNNHLAYAGQWFFFAIIASVIYVLAVRRRQG
ncbi:MAG TPA: SURF1 family cytochrome oxidase biogenesis protein [Sphingomonas sp.]|jgi:surfeit locus 1 family protein